jgi:DNA-binding response OmpR family regulator
MAKKILVVDDSRTSLFLEQMILKKQAYDVVTAQNGEEGVSKAMAEKPDLVLMDVVMPKMNGFEAVRRLRQEPATRDIPVIMVTTRGEGPNVETGFESGCNDYVTKPVDALELLTKVKSCLHEA